MGASGLWSVTRAHSTRLSDRHDSAMRWARVSIRSTGSRSTAAFTVGDEASVVDGVRKSSEAAAARCRARARGRSTNVWPSRVSKSKTPWCAEALDAGDGQLVGHGVVLPSRHRGRRTAQRVAGGAYVVHPQAPTPAPRQQRDQGGVGVLALVDRPRRAVRRRAGCRGTTCGSRPPAAGSPAPRARRAPASSSQLCAGALGEAQARVEHDPLARRCRRPRSRRAARPARGVRPRRRRRAS